MDRVNRIYVYKMTADNGGAPCIFGEQLLSLAICKPKIRSTARPDNPRGADWIIGIGGKNLGEGIIYVARTTGKAGVEYYRKRSFARRPDCIYKFKDGKLIRKATALYHKVESNMPRDVGIAPNYCNARVLLSSDFRFFGRNREPVPDRLQAFFKSIGQGHRVNHDDSIRGALLILIETLWQKYPAKMILGEPHSEPDGYVCFGTDEGSEACSLRPKSRC